MGRKVLARRVRFALSLPAALAVALVVGVGSGNATLAGGGGGGGSVACTSASKTIAAVTLDAHWCWDAANYLTSSSFSISQGSNLDGLWYTSGGPRIQTQTGGPGHTTYSETFYVNWWDASGDTMDSYYWGHVVGGSYTLDFVETNEEIYPAQPCGCG